MPSSQPECKAMIYKYNENVSVGTKMTFKQTVTTILFSRKTNSGDWVLSREFQYYWLLEGEGDF